MNLKKKLLLAFTSVAAILVVIGVIASWALKHTVTNYQHVTDVNLYGIKHLGDLYRAEKDAVIAIAHLTDNNLADVAKDSQALEKAISNFEDAAKKYEVLPDGDGEVELWNHTRQAWDKLVDLCRQAVKLSTSRPDDHTKRDALLAGEYLRARAAFRDAVEKLIQFQEKEAETWGEAAHTTYAGTVTTMTLIVLLGFALSLGLGFMISRSLSTQLSSIAQSLSEGAQRLAQASTQISASTEKLSASTSQQAAALQETSSSIEEMNQMVQRNAENAQRSSDTTNQSQASARRGNDSMSMMMTSVQEINNSNNDIKAQIEQSNREIGEIIKVISEIGNKTKVINDIVFQTKLLAFNASVEAARAGEHGKGFAVVADEVGNLAQMSGNAAKEISSMLDGSIERVKRIITDTQSRVESLIASSKARVDSGNETAKQCGEALSEIVASVTTVNSMVGEIATASKEQAQGVGEISRAMAQMEQVTQSNAQATSELAAAGRELANQAGVLRGLVQALSRTVTGGAATNSVTGDAFTGRATAKTPGKPSKPRRAA